jgi:Flp pilus assembly protein TadD
MPDPASAPPIPNRWLAYFAPALLLISVLLAYSNSPGNAFALDDWHTIEQNTWIRSTRNIPKYFADAKTFSTLSTNVDYRPVLQATFAINYAMTGSVIDEDRADSWHWTNIFIHFGVSCCIFFIGRRLFGSLGLAPVPGLSARVGDYVALAAAFLFSIHPVTTGPVNYISARSSSLTTLFVLLALLFYLRALARPQRWWRFVVAGVFFTLGLFTKVEAVSLVAALILAEFLLNPAMRDKALLDRLIDWHIYRRLGPFLLIAIVYLYIWYSKTGVAESTTRASHDDTPLSYLGTQFRAWWYYIAQVFAPINLVADYPTYPRSYWHKFLWYMPGPEPRTLDLRPLLALAGWLVTGILALLTIRRAPVITFLIVCFFAYLAPHSSIMPLAEHVNEHRPYLAYSSVFLLLAIGLGLALTKLSRWPGITAAVLAAILAIPLLALTRDRNAVWKDAESLWGDTVKKVPDSTRVQMNYGLALMVRDHLNEAEFRFRESIRLSPNYTWAHSNLGILLERRGNMEGAQAAHDEAVRVSQIPKGVPTLDVPYYWRANFRAGLRNVSGAAEDYITAANLCSAPFRELAGAAECLIRLGRTPDAQPYIDRGQARDPSPGHADFERERLWVRNLLGPADSTQQATEGEKHRARGEWLQAEWRFREAIRLDPKNISAHVNLAIALAGRGHPAVALQWYDEAVRLAPNTEMPLYWRGRFHASQKNWDLALADFRASRAAGGPSSRDTAAILETLTAAGRPEDAATELASLAPEALATLDRDRADFRTQVLKNR